MRVNSRKKPKWLSLSHVYDICPTSIPWKLSRTCFLPSFRQKVTTLLFWIIDINNYSVARSIDSDYGQNFSKNARNVIFMFFRRGIIFSSVRARNVQKYRICGSFTRRKSRIKVRVRDHRRMIRWLEPLTWCHYKLSNYVLSNFRICCLNA